LGSFPADFSGVASFHHHCPKAFTAGFVAHVRTNGSLMISSILKKLKPLVRFKIFAPFFGVLYVLAMRRPFGRKKPGQLVMLAFNSERWMQDLSALDRTGQIHIILASRRIQEIVNALFASPVRATSEHYFLESNPETLRRRQLNANFIAAMVPVIKWLSGADCAATPTVHYAVDHPWAAGFDQGGLPFAAIHKEFTVIDRRHLQERVDLAKSRNQKFLGSAILVVNDIASELFGNAEIFPRDGIHVAGLLRMDNIVAAAKSRQQEKPEARNAVTLFSFGHYSGGVGKTEARSYYFSKSDHEGFVDLFREVHGAFAEVALRHPQIDFWIKTKPVGGFYEEIDATFRHATGRGLAEIPNCKFINPRTPAPELMMHSRLVIGLNSTSLIEARALGCPTIMPSFAEAQGKYAYNVYFPDFHDVFAVPKSRAEFVQTMEDAIALRPIHKDDEGRVAQLLRQYVNNQAGDCALRTVAILNGIVAARKSPQAASTARPDLQSPQEND
jgi:hypothetical protein